MSKAFRCDVCGKYTATLPIGVIYDNKNKRRKDLCSDCLSEVWAKIDEMVERARDINNP